MIEDDGLDRIYLSCENCGCESHFLGTFCWWGVPFLAVGIAGCLGFIAFTLYLLLTT